MTNNEKRRNWTSDEDRTFLIQVAADRPFGAEKGQLKKAWQAEANKLMACDHFGRVMDGEKVQNRFLKLVNEHRKFDAESARLSGSDQVELEKHVLLDDICTLLDDMKNAPATQTQGDSDKDKIEQGGLLVREMAMKTLKRQCGGDADESQKRPAVENRRNSLATVIAAESERELAVREKVLDFQRQKLDCEIQQRELDRDERKAEREHQVVMAKIENDKLTNMIKALLESRK
ncbi:hypothetical protein DYB35_012673 [Aphanomyces astaci]|uniref:Myb-like domain-containing protein n=1 Tax=Aphanomyces astaci TaxID=112090 RepID=A0A418D5C4_APHAT|nr:hypothetical protein DYB35_012673 [Aphanomyces astaci]